MTTETKQNDSKLVPEVQRQYSLLREFNLEQAQNDNGILFFIDYLPPMDVKFKGCTSDLATIFVEYGGAYGPIGKAYYTEELKMKPLCWIEGKPVYKGDVLYYKSYFDSLIHEHKVHSLKETGLFDETGIYFVEIAGLTWDKPQEKTDNRPNYIQLYPTWQDAATDLCNNPRKGSVEVHWRE